MNIDLIRPQELTDDLLAKWTRFQESNPSLESPYFRPEFTQAVAQVRSDVEVAVLREGGQIAGFFPFQRGTLKLAKPVGGKLSDYHGVIGASDLEFDVPQLLRACGLAAWDFDHVLASQQGFQPYWRATGKSPALDLSAGFSAYAEARRAAGTEEIKKTLQKYRKCDRERGPLKFEFHCPDLAVFETLKRWKSDQYRRTGFTDVFSFPWTVELLQNLLKHPRPGLSAVQSVVWKDDQPVAIQYHLRSRHILHAWFPAYDHDYAKYSPGLMVMIMIAQHAPEYGIAKLDLGKGDEQYKWSLASSSTTVAEGTAGNGSPALWLLNGWRRGRDWVNNSPLQGAAAVPLRMLKPLRAWFAFR